MDKGQTVRLRSLLLQAAASASRRGDEPKKQFMLLCVDAIHFDTEPPGPATWQMSTEGFEFALYAATVARARYKNFGDWLRGAVTTTLDR